MRCNNKGMFDHLALHRSFYEKPENKTMGVFLLTKAVKENKIFPIDNCESRESTSLINLGNNSDSYKMLISILYESELFSYI